MGRDYIRGMGAVSRLGQVGIFWTPIHTKSHKVTRSHTKAEQVFLSFAIGLL